MAGKLTKLQVENMQPDSSRIEVPDAAAPGLWLVVQSSGVKSWAFRYRAKVDQKPRKFTIGRYPDYSLAEAREEALELGRSVRRGRDPAQEKRAARARALDVSDTVGAQLDDFLKLYVRANNKANTIKAYEQVIEAEIRPLWKDRKIDAITKNDVIQLLNGMIDRGVTTHANRVFSKLRKFFNWLVEKDRLAASPCAGLKPPSKEKTRDRKPSGDEIRWLWFATEWDRPRGNGPPLPAREAYRRRFDRCIRLLLLSAQRRMEIGGLMLPEIDDGPDMPHILLPPSRTKNGEEHMVPLTKAIRWEIDEARAIVDEEEAEDDSAPSSLVFRLTAKWGWSKLKAELDDRMLNVAKNEAAANGRDPELVTIPHWTIHDLRRTAATYLAKLKVEPHVIEAALNHISGKVSGVAKIYNRYEYFDEKRDALQRWERFIVLHCEGPVAGFVDEEAAA